MSLTAEQVYKIAFIIGVAKSASQGEQAQNAHAVFQKLYYELTSSTLAKNEHSVMYGLVERLKNRYDALTEQDTSQIRSLMERLDAVVRHELQTTRAFVEMTPLQGMLDYGRMGREGTRILFSPQTSVWEIPQMTRDDLDEAARCLSFQCATASVMIGLRAVEGMLRHLYKTLTGSDSSKGWADLLTDLQRVVDQMKLDTGKLFSYLDWVRTIRNRAEHPDARFEVSDAEKLLIHAAMSIEQMHFLSRQKAKPMQS